MVIRIGDIAKLPDALQAELENRSHLKAEALAHRLVNKLSSKPIPANPNVFNPYLEEVSPPQDNSNSNSGSDPTLRSARSNWGGKGW